ncbi:hypothetical protein KY348_01005 [Candidatus Woesearchaeota archaeon]|nr:hypothetical protein [Candidatus Woesearchaeota archaeon]
MKRHNLHTHTAFSDGYFLPKGLIDMAKEENLEILGISEHAFTRKVNIYSQITDELYRYLDFVKDIQKSTKDLDLKIGIEIDVSKFFGANPAELPFDALNEFDYVLFEYVGKEKALFPRFKLRDIRSIVDVRDKFTVPIGLAHNDLQKNYNEKEEEIANILSKEDIFLELNAGDRNLRGGMYYYEHFSKKLLEELAKNKVKVVVGTDFHSYEDKADLDDAYYFVKENNLKYHELVL